VVRTIPISAGQVGTTQFNLSKEQQTWLMNSGKDAAAKFLEGWDPADYVNGHGERL
jgi:hypothetical protein